ncbi:MAG: beta strand repeat-containing protein, partial [Hyphomicrobiaceae bacterium]
MPLINGTAGNDSIDSTGVNGAGQGTTAGDDTVHGLGGDDTIVAGGGADVLYGGDGFDILVGQAGNDTLYGGSEALGGFESGPAEGWRGARANYNGSASAITVVYDTVATVTGGVDVGTDTLINVQQVRGTNFADSFTATANYSGMFGNFAEFEGMNGNDTINGNGNTRASYQSATAAVTVDLTAGTATSSAGGNAASIGTDTLTNVNSVRGSAFADTLSGANNGNFLVFIGGGGNDTITGSLIANPLQGGSEARYDGATEGIVAVLGVNSSVVGGASTGTDELHAIDRIRGSNFNDQFTAASDFVGAFGNFNHFEGMDGDDTINGNGNTRISYQQALSGVTVNFLTGTASSTAGGDAAGVGVDTFTNVDNVRGSNYADTFTAAGVHGQFQFEGRAGNDTITGTGLGINNFDFNVARYSQATAAITANLGAASSVTGDASVGTDTLISVEAIRGSQFADTFVATGAFNGQFGGHNDFEGEGGNDTITGNGMTVATYANALAAVTVNLQTGTATSSAGGDAAGIGTDTIVGGVNAIRGSNFADTLTGSNGAQAERFRGGAGNDTLDGGGGALDSANYRNSAAGVVVNLATGTAADGFGGTDTLLNIEGVAGSEFNDSITGDGGANILQGQGGNDTISGGGGADLLVGDDDDAWGGAFGTNVLFDAGNDSILGGAGNDTILGGAGNDNMVGNQDNDSINGGAGDDYAHGGAGNDTLIGEDGNDRLDGALGNDTIEGGIGSDVMIANQGDDLLIGGADGDYMHGGQNNDTLQGGDGNDVLLGGVGSDSIDGGTGHDGAAWSGLRSAYTVTNNGGGSW